MNSEYYYDILLNEKILATVGPSSLKQLHVSFGVSDGEPTVKAGGISEKESGLLYINWLEKTVDFSDTLKISPSAENSATTPRHIKKLQQGMESSDEDNLCDFCNGTEEEVGQLIRLGGSPQICRSCIKLCVAEFESKN